MIPQVMVPRFRSNLALRPINRIKHVTDLQFAVALDTNQDNVIATTVDAPTLAATSQVETGSTINGFFITAEVVNTGTTGVLANCYFMLFKNPGSNLTFPKPNVVGGSDNKKYVIHQEMIMLQMIDNSNPRTIFKGVIKVPKHLRRNGPDDEWVVRIFSPGVEITGCIQSHYKEFR